MPRDINHSKEWHKDIIFKEQICKKGNTKQSKDKLYQPEKKGLRNYEDGVSGLRNSCFWPALCRGCFGSWKTLPNSWPGEGQGKRWSLRCTRPILIMFLCIVSTLFKQIGLFYQQPVVDYLTDSLAAVPRESHLLRSHDQRQGRVNGDA